VNLLTPLRPDAGDVVDSAAVAAALQALPGTDASTLRREGAALLKAALHGAYDRIAARLAAAPGEGMAIAADYARATDAVVALVHEFTMTRLYPLANRTAGERVAVVALGGWGRAEMARHSDVDILFLSPGRRNAWVEQRVETMLYLLWDLGLKLGHQSASVDEMLRLATDDMSVRTALLEARAVCGDGALFDDLAARFAAEVQADSAPEFVAAKLAERNARHVRVGDSRYVVEPDVKNGKGGLRDLHTLLWIGKYAFQVRRAPELVDRGLFTHAELRRFGRAERFFWSVRCHLHVLTGRAEERLGSRRSARSPGACISPTGPASPRGTFHAVLLPAGEDRRPPVGRLSRRTGRKLRAQGLALRLSRADRKLSPPHRPAVPLRARPRAHRRARRRACSPPSPSACCNCSRSPISTAGGAPAHDAAGGARRAAGGRRPARGRRRQRLVPGRPDEPAQSGRPLSGLNEAGILGRFVPDFGRIVAQMQFDMYHHYTVDEHTIRALGPAVADRAWAAEGRSPARHRPVPPGAASPALFVAVFLHDIAKGRGGDHSELGEAVARNCARASGWSPRKAKPSPGWSATTC
jgi:[protein-PII] uridylyltransferase